MRQHRLIFGLVGLFILTAAGIGMAISGAASSAPPTTEFLCADGERLLVSTEGESMRVRTGTGIFRLQAEAGRQQYLGQFMSVDIGPETLELTRQEQHATVRCKAIRNAT